MNELAQNTTPTENGNSVLMSVDFSGRLISKVDLMLYINNLLRIVEQFDKLSYEHKQRSARSNTLHDQLKRRTFSLPTRQKPQGFAALSRKKMREYEDWLSHENERKEELARKEKAEDERIAQIKAERDKLNKECQAFLTAEMNLFALFKRECEKDVISPDYRDKNSLQMLLNYLYNGRANTLAEAINLLHTEQHQFEVIKKLEQQNSIARLQLAEQQRIADNQIRTQLALLEEQRMMRDEHNAAMKNIANKLDDIRYYEQLQFLKNL